MVISGCTDCKAALRAIMCTSATPFGDKRCDVVCISSTEFRIMPSLWQYYMELITYISHVVCLCTGYRYTGIPGTFPDSVLPLRNFRKTEKSPVVLCQTRESNPRPLARQSHLLPANEA
ncbi:hypothetical protein SFRURICE_019348, partial [Spodoptera frugiperda]